MSSQFLITFHMDAGKNCCLNASTVDVFLKNEPQPTSTKNFVHLAQSKSSSIMCTETEKSGGIDSFGSILLPLFEIT